jgi:hypothetical protein
VISLVTVDARRYHPGMKVLAVVSLLVAPFLSSLAAENPGGEFPPFVCAAEGAKKVMEYGTNGSVVWDYPAEFSRDVWRLPNGNTLFCYNNDYVPARNDNPSGAMEVTRDRKIVWQYATTGQVWTCQRVLDGSTMVGNSSAGKLLIVSPRGDLVREIVLRSKGGHSCIRNAREIPGGNFLVAEEGARAVREYAATGEFLRELKVPFAPYSVVRLTNGNTVVCGQKSMVEVDATGKTLWSLEGTEIPDMGIRWFAGIQVMPNGNVFIANAGGRISFLEVSRAKKVVWNSGAITPPGPFAHGIQRLDTPWPLLK